MRAKERGTKSIKDLFIHVDHPDFEVHNFSSLAEKTGWSPTGLSDAYAQGRFTLIATNFYSSKNMFAIKKSEIAYVKALRDTVSQKRGAKHKRIDERNHSR